MLGKAEITDVPVATVLIETTLSAHRDVEFMGQATELLKLS
jgi:hypothetical protein